MPSLALSLALSTPHRLSHPALPPRTAREEGGRKCVKLWDAQWGRGEGGVGWRGCRRKLGWPASFLFQMFSLIFFFFAFSPSLSLSVSPSLSLSPPILLLPLLLFFWVLLVLFSLSFLAVPFFPPEMERGNRETSGSLLAASN